MFWNVMKVYFHIFMFDFSSFASLNGRVELNNEICILWK